MSQDDTSGQLVPFDDEIAEQQIRPVVSTKNYKTLTARQRQPQLFNDQG